MSDKILSKAEVGSFLDKLKADYQIHAPVQKDSEMVWAPIERAEDLVWEFTNTDLSPKSYFFPQTECLMHFKNDQKDPEGMIMQEEPPLEKPRALFNIRPCDAKAFQVLDKVFCKDEKSLDVYWKDKRDKTLLIGLACNNPCPTCFCTSMNCGPHHEEGLDILLTDLGDRLLVRPVTEKGQDLTADMPEASQEDIDQAANNKEQAEASITSQVDMDNINARSVLELYEHPAWDRVYESCINCGTCTYFCPTCHCFDIQDESQGDFGRRVRNWDTCMSWLFTQHTSGHNPRGTKKDRVRQRFMHKFKYMPIKLEGAIGCVGCGRCTRKCPVNIDVREVVSSMNS